MAKYIKYQWQECVILLVGLVIIIGGVLNAIHSIANQ